MPLLVCVGCLDDVAPPSGITRCTFERTPFQVQLLARIGLDDTAAFIGQACQEPRQFTVQSQFADVPDADIEPALNVIRVEAVRQLLAPLDLDGYPCGEGGEERGEIALCDDPASSPTPTDTALLLYETDEPLPLADPRNVYDLGFAFEGDPANNYAAPEDRPRDYYAGTDTWFQARYTPERGWSLESFAIDGGVPVAVISQARVIIDGPVVALVVPLDAFIVTPARLRLHLIRHTGDQGQAPPHDWSGFLFPRLSQDLF